MSARRVSAALCAASLSLLFSCNRSGEADIARGNLFAARGRWEDAAAAYARAAQASDRARPLVLLGHVRLAQDDVAAARRAYEEALARDPDGALEARVGLARLAAREKRWDEALTALDQALGAAPDDLSALLSHAHVLLRRGQAKDFERALADATRACRIAPGNPHALYTRGNAELAAGHLDAAARSFQDLEALAPDLPLAAYGRAKLDVARGHPQAALESLRRAKTLAKDAWRPDEVRADPAFAALEAEIP